MKQKPHPAPQGVHIWAETSSRHSATNLLWWGTPIRYKLADIPSARNLASPFWIQMLPPNHQTQSETHVHFLMSQSQVTWPSVLCLQICGNFIGRIGKKKLKQHWPTSAAGWRSTSFRLTSEKKYALGNLWCLTASSAFVAAPADPCETLSWGPGAYFAVVMCSITSSMARFGSYVLKFSAPFASAFRIL